MIELKSSISGKTVTFAQCMFGADWQKYTTFMYSAGFDEQLAPLHALLYTHPDGTHTASAGGVRDASGTWNSREAAAFPADLNLFLSQTILSLVTGSGARPELTVGSPLDEAEPPVADAYFNADIDVSDHPESLSPSLLPPAGPTVPTSPLKPAPSPPPRACPRASGCCSTPSLA